MSVEDRRPVGWASHALRARAGLERVSVAGVLVFVTVVLLLCFPYFEKTRNANEWPRLMQGIAVVEDGDWSLDGPSARVMGAPGPDTAISEHDGHRYPNKPPGTTLAAAGGYKLAKGWAASHDEPLTLRAYTWWARLLGGVLPTVLLCAVAVWRLPPSLGRAATVAAIVIYAVGTPAASYAHLLYGHQLAAALLFIGTSLLLDASGPTTARGRVLSEGARAAVAGVGGALAGAAVTVEYGAVFAGLPIATMLLARARRRGGLVAALCGLMGALVPILWLAGYHRDAFGSPWATGYHHAATERFAELHGQGLLGLSLPKWDGFATHVLSADGGLLWWAPAAVLAIYGLGVVAISATHREDDMRTEARVHLGIVVIYLLVISGLSFEGGWRVGPRYFVVALPSLLVGWAMVLGQIRSAGKWVFVVTALCTYAVIVNGLAANLWPHFDLTNVNQPVAEVLLPMWNRDLSPYGPLRELGIGGAQHVVYGSVLVLWLALLHLYEPTSRNVIGMLVGAALGITLVFATHLVPKHGKGEANLAYIVDRAWEPDPQSPRDPRSLVLERR